MNTYKCALRAIVFYVFFTGAASAAPALIFDGSGSLIGATGVEVLGESLNVEFRDGTCAELFDGCDENFDYFFDSEGRANEASRALAQQVFPGVAPTSIEGCGPNRTDTCSVLTPWNALVTVSIARVIAPDDARFVGNTRIGRNDDIGNSPFSTFAIWSLPNPPSRCGDGLDNDGDGLIDFPNDPGCSDQSDDNEADATLIFDGAGKVIGALGVDILGTTHDVEFRDGTCTALYGGCDESSDFFFGSEGHANAASLSLARHVLPGLTPKSIEGCGPGPIGSCRILTPWNTTVTVSMALSVGPDDARFIGNMFLNPNTDSGDDDAKTFAVWSLTELPAQCADGLDNDSDGLIDYPIDPGCVSIDDDNEIDPLLQCSDGIDNDADGLIDFPEDPGCIDAADNDEFNPLVFQGIPDFIAGRLGANSKADQTTATINGRLILLIDRENSDRYRCYDDKLATVPCGSEGIPSKDQIFVDLAKCPTLDMGDGTVLGSDTVEGCLLYRAVTPANRAPKSMIVAFQVQHHYSTGGTYTVTLDSCCRASSFLSNDVHVNNPGTHYRLETVIDVGTGNSGPSSAVPPVVACPVDGLCQFDIPAVDDTLLPNFRLAGSNEASPVGSFNQPPGASIGAVTGRYLWDTRGLPIADPNESHNYSTQVVVSDGVAKSTVELLIRLVSDDSEPPVIDPPIRPCLAVFPNQCVPPGGEDPPGEVDPPQDSLPICGTSRVFRRGGQYQFTITASDPDVDDTVTLNITGLPNGAEMDPELPIVGNPARSDFAWVPLVLGKYVINFDALSSGGATAQCPVTIDVVDVVAPDFELVSGSFTAEPWGHPSFPTAWRIRPIAIVRNIGNVTASARVDFSMTRRESPMIRRSAGKLIVLEPGERQIVETFNEIWIDLDGTYDYAVAIDDRDEVVEIDETNNSLSFVTSFNVGGLSADMDGDLDVDIEDVRIVFTARNQEAQPGDPRDFNKDGVINVLDARMAVLACTQPRCR